MQFDDHSTAFVEVLQQDSNSSTSNRAVSPRTQRPKLTAVYAQNENAPDTTDVFARIVSLALLRQSEAEQRRAAEGQVTP